MSQLKYRYPRRFFTYSTGRLNGLVAVKVRGRVRCQAVAAAPRRLSFGVPARHVAIRGDREPRRGQCRAGSLTGAVHLSKGNAGVPRRARWGRKPRVEQKGKSSLDLDFQYEYGP